MNGTSSGTLLPVLAVLVAVLLALGPLAVVASRPVRYGPLLACVLGALAVLLYLLGGAAPVAMVLPFGLPGQSTILSLDGVSALFLLLLMLTGSAAAMAALDDHGTPPPTRAAFPVFIAAMALTLLAGDAFTLVVGFELMSLASFALVLTQHRDAGVQAAGQLYFGMAMISAVCLVAALALLSGHGTSFAVMRATPPEGWRAPVILFLALLGAGSKAGLAPLHIWLPPAHTAAPSHVSALMSGIMTKVALYVVVRLVFDLCGPEQPLWWGLPLLAMGIASAVIGAFRANLETDIKAVLACSTIENIGLITIGLGLALAARAADLTALAGLALGGALLHAMAHGLFKSMLFLCAGAVQYGAGSRLLARLGGLIQRMPITAACLLLGAACLAGLPPGAGFAGEWMLFQAVLGAVRLGGLGLQILVCVLAAAMALAVAMAASAAVRLVGVALLGRPRSQNAAAAVEAAPPVRWAILGLAVLVGLLGLFPALVLALAQPAVRALAGVDLAEHFTVVSIIPQSQAPGYAPMGVALLLAFAGIGIAAVLRARAVQGHRTGPAWDCGFGAPPPWLPFGDPLTQYGGGSFAQPLRRVLGPALMRARIKVDLPEPGDTRPAGFTEEAADPAETLLFAPAVQLRVALSRFADRLQFLTVRQSLTVIFVALVAFLTTIAVLEQL